MFHKSILLEQVVQGGVCDPSRAVASLQATNPSAAAGPGVFLTYSAEPGNKGFADILIRESLRQSDRPRP